MSAWHMVLQLTCFKSVHAAFAILMKGASLDANLVVIVSYRNWLCKDRAQTDLPFLYTTIERQNLVFVIDALSLNLLFVVLKCIFAHFGCSYT